MEHTGYNESLLYRIISGHLRLKVDDHLILIKEPTSDLIEKSYFIYDEAKEEAYAGGAYVDSDMDLLLLELDIWNPSFDKDIEKLQKKIEDEKVNAYKNYLDLKRLKSIKLNIANLNKIVGNLYSKKNTYNHLTCSAIAEQTRLLWLLKKCSKNKYIELYRLYSLYSDMYVKVQDFRYLARTDPWRSMWICAIKSGDLFNKPSTELTKDQLTLCMYSRMYDNVYESSDAPPEKVISDDDCLDGWFLTQKRKSDHDRLNKSTDDGISNEKIKNSSQVFIMADSDEYANSIMDLNDDRTKYVINSRNETMKSKGTAKSIDFIDVQADIDKQRVENARR